MSSHRIVDHFLEEGIVVDREAFVALVNKLMENKLMKPLILSYFKKLGKRYASKLLTKGVLEEGSRPLEAVLDVCKINGYIKDYKVKKRSKKEYEVRVEGAIFGEEARRRGKRGKVDGPLAKFMEGMYEVLTMEPVSVSELSCIAEGSDVCTFLFRVA